MANSQQFTRLKNQGKGAVCYNNFMKRTIIFIFLLLSLKIFAEEIEDKEIFTSIEKIKWGLEWNPEIIKKAFFSQNEKVRSSMVYVLPFTKKQETKEYFISLLQSSIPWERFQGIKGLLCLGVEEFDLVKELLNDEQEFIKISAIFYLENNLEAVFKLLNSNNINLNLFGIELLSCKKEEGERYLLNYLKDSRDEIRAKATEGFILFSNPFYKREILEALKKETYYYVQDIMAKVIVYYYEYSIIEEGIFYPKLSKIIYNTLKFFKKEEDFLKDLSKQINLLSSDRVDKLSEVLSFFKNNKEITEFLQILDKKTTAKNIKAEILEFFASNSLKEGLPYFKKFLKDKDPYIKGNSIWGLASLKNRDHLQEIEKELKNENDYVRWCALWALGEILERDSLKYAKEFLNDKSPEVRQTAMDILNKYEKN